MTALDRLIPKPRLVEIDRIDLDAQADLVWYHVRHGALAHSRLTRGLFTLRTLWDRRKGTVPSTQMRLDDMTSSVERPGFQVLVDKPTSEVAVAAIGQVWRLNIPFAHVDSAQEFATFAVRDFVKVAWAIRVTPRPVRGSHVELELRVDATSEAAWQKFRRYFVVIGRPSHYIRRALLRSLGRGFGRSTECADQLRLPGDERLPDAARQLTHTIDIAAPPDAIWPWLVQMGSRRAGFYSIDLLDNAGLPSAREIHPELQSLAVEMLVPAMRRGPEGFEVLQLDPGRALVLGGLHDLERKRQLPFAHARPGRYWHVTWAFVLERLDARSTRVYARARAAFSPAERWHACWLRPVHHVMQTAQLRNLARRAEGRMSRNDWRDATQGMVGAVRMLTWLLTPFLCSRRSRWGLKRDSAKQPLPGDELIAQPLWSWTHGVEIEAPADAVWPWVAQVGADRGGFYSYQWLENLAGCGLRNAETVHPEWEVREGQALVLHPDVAPLRIVSVERGRYFVAHAPADPRAVAEHRPWVAASWLFLVEPITPHRCRFVSRYRAACSNDFATRISFGPAVAEPIAFEMDRRMLLGVKERAEAAMEGVVAT